MSSEEKDLILRLKTADEDAFKEIYLLYSKRIYGNFLKLVKSESIAQELLQDVFMKIWDKKYEIDPEKSFRSFLFCIAENLAYDFFRKASRDKILQKKLIAAAIDQYTHVEESMFEKEKSFLLYEAIKTLPPQRKLVFELCKLEGKSYDEVSRLLAISQSTISDHIVKANRFLKEYCLKNQSSVISLILLSVAGHL